jgi:hypothetical protein
MSSDVSGQPPHGRYYAELVPPSSPEGVFRPRFRNCSTRARGRNGNWSGWQAACRRAVYCSFGILRSPASAEVSFS